MGFWGKRSGYFFVLLVASSALAELPVPTNGDANGIPMDLPVFVTFQSYRVIQDSPEKYVEPIEKVDNYGSEGLLYFRAYDVSKKPKFIDTRLSFFSAPSEKGSPRKPINIKLEREALVTLLNRIRLMGLLASYDVDGTGVYAYANIEDRPTVIVQPNNAVSVELDMVYTSIEDYRFGGSGSEVDKTASIDYRRLSEQLLPAFKLSTKPKDQTYFVPFKDDRLLPVVLLEHQADTAEVIAVPLFSLSTSGNKQLYRFPASTIRKVFNPERYEQLIQQSTKIDKKEIPGWLKNFSIEGNEAEAYQQQVDELVTLVNGPCSEKIASNQ